MPSILSAFVSNKKCKFNTSATGSAVTTTETTFPICIEIDKDGKVVKLEEDDDG